METGKRTHINQKDISKAGFDSLSASEKVDLFVQGYRVPEMQSKAATLEMIRRKIDRENSLKPARNLRIYWSAAASIVLIALLSSVYFYLNPRQNHILTAKGQHIDFTLPDGSEIKVNADSKISYSASGFTKERVLKLDGEAFFSVKKGKPFVVKTHLGTVEVLGTTLNVFARDKAFHVSCLTGKVKVMVNEQSVVILPGEEVELVSGILQKTANSFSEKMVGWIRGEFHFDGTPLISTFEEIERQFNVRIAAKGIEDRFYTGSFSNTNLTEVLETVCLPMKLEYEIKNGNKISIKPKKD